jgi:type I restriction-modification system DNA methylase subunit
MQTSFKDSTLSKQKKQEFILLIRRMLAELAKEVGNHLKLDELILSHNLLIREHTKNRLRPEDITKELIVDPILQFLGYNDIARSSGSAGNIERREADYILKVDNERILVEAEPLNKQLFEVKEQGVEQVKSNLEKRSFKADLGIATNGFEWVLLKYDEINYNCKTIEYVNLRPFFTTKPKEQRNILDTNQIAESFYLHFASNNIIEASDQFTRTLEEKKEIITSRFYEDYIRFVFGYDIRRDENKKCLLSTLKAPSSANDSDNRLFVVTLMSRLIFIKFLEDKKLVKRKFLLDVLKSYKENKIPISFYKAYLQPLFYDVLNTPLSRRKQEILDVSEFDNIPYLNGGLFRQVIDNEFYYDVDNAILELIIELLQKYRFTLEDNSDALNPDILGLVFEKTINYLTGEGKTDRRGDLGAYYTPDDVTTYISRETIRNRIFDLIKEYLALIGWKTSEINQYESFENFLDYPPRHPKTIKEIYEKIAGISVLDPACGSGHFLTSAMKELFRIRKRLVSTLNEETNDYDIKRDIISRNLFGVDVENSAVEIARLRLWLSLIENLDTTSRDAKIDTLPNIEYNVEEGNSLLGYTSAPDVTQMGIDGDDDASLNKIFEEIDALKQEFRLNSDPHKTEETKEIIEKKINLYNEALNRALVPNLAVDKNITSSLPGISKRYSLPMVSKMNPFHWRLKFSDVFATKEGFDVIVGNPPYVESHKLDYPTPEFVTQKRSSTYAFFLEMSLKIVCRGGYVGFIVPLATFCTERMFPIHQILRRECSIISISNFDIRPGKIFQGREESRSSIIIYKKKKI